MTGQVLPLDLVSRGRLKVLVFREPSDGLWNVVRGTIDDLRTDREIPDGDWIAEGVGSWERAMRIACEATR